MAKSSLKKAKTMSSAPNWKTKWPRNGELRSWFLCMLDKCDAMENPVEGASKAHLPITALAEHGHTDEALRYVDRFLRKQPADDSLEIVRLSRLGAQICLDRGDFAQMERYLSRAAAAPVHRKCDRGWPERAVREFRAHNGLLDPAEAVNEEQRIEAMFSRGRRRFREAIDRKQRAQALAAVGEMQQALEQADKDDVVVWFYHRTLLESLAEVGDAAAAKRFLKTLAREQAEEMIDYRTLASIGLTAEAVARAAAEVRNRLAELATMEDPNIHFPVRGLCSALEFLADHGKQKEAKTWLSKTLKSMGKWPVHELGWTTAAVYQMLAEAADKLGDSAAAKKLLSLSNRDAAQEKRPQWRKGAVEAAMETEAKIGNLEDVIAKARKLRSPTQRRSQLGKLLARSQRWKELAAVLSEAASPLEAADLCWVVKFELPGGAPG